MKMHTTYLALTIPLYFSSLSPLVSGQENWKRMHSSVGVGTCDLESFSDAYSKHRKVRTLTHCWFEETSRAQLMGPRIWSLTCFPRRPHTRPYRL